MTILAVVMSRTSESSEEENDAAFPSPSRKRPAKSKRRRKRAVALASSESEDEGTISFANLYADTPEYPVFRSSAWSVDKLVAKRNSHLPARNGAAQLEYFAQWNGLSVNSCSWVPAELLESSIVERFASIPLITSSSGESDEDVLVTEETDCVSNNCQMQHRIKKKRRMRAKLPSPPQSHSGLKSFPRRSVLSQRDDEYPTPIALKRVTVPIRRTDVEDAEESLDEEKPVAVWKKDRRTAGGGSVLKHRMSAKMENRKRSDTDDSETSQHKEEPQYPNRFNSFRTMFNGKNVTTSHRISKKGRRLDTESSEGSEDEAHSSQSDSTSSSDISAKSNAAGSSSADDVGWQPGLTDDEAEVLSPDDSQSVDLSDSEV